MKIQQWYELGLVGVILMGISQVLTSINGEVVSFALIMGVLGGAVTQRLMPRHQTNHPLSMVTEAAFILQSLLILLVLVLSVSWLVEPSFAHIYGETTLPVRSLIWTLSGTTGAMHNVFSHLWPVLIYILGLLWLRSTVQVVMIWQLSWRRTVMISNLVLILLTIVFNGGWLFTRTGSLLPTSLFLLPFAIGSLIATKRQTSHAERAIQRGPVDVNFALLGYVVLMLIGCHMSAFQNHWLQLGWLLIGCIGSGWLLFMVQPVMVTIRQWHVLMVGYLWYLYYWPLVWLFDSATYPLRYVGILPLALVLAVVDYVGYQWLTRRPHIYQRRLLISVVVICIGVLGSFSSYQASKIAPHQQTKSESSVATSTTKQATARSTKYLAKHSTVSPTRQRQQLLSAWQKIIDRQTVKVGIAIYSPRTKQTVTYTKDADGSGYYVASTVKASILTELLHQRDQGNLTFTPGEQTLAESMIRNSDNDAATGLLSNGLGSYGALNNLYQNLKMTHTTANLSSWSMTKTTPADQVRLLRTIYYPSDYLTKQSKHYIQNLMGTVSHEQSWGVSKSAPNYQLKNGWMDLSDNGLGWQVNSIGHVYDQHRDPQGYVIAIYTNQDETMSQGVDLVESLAAVTHQIMAP
ncbi:class A beta-lactamase-related serine hydrolase [Lactiplantibacillus paraplantarum]|uniref:serine hydrolase n=1 Tax=Lactiplantibacillus paraplantarum TaxID=60520 RepID=UPI0007E446AC|nr:serine hydrolase [Lactiplantibacillus paraplantarum]MCW1909639.1 class A beta-lactamase-related serine hydrolase [Lactiplantibacillus paraplantarum]OAX75768.1 hypothetical protein A0U96_05660 [Lactiplantibacillus plantarum]RDG11475.1 hypothetical protein DQM08_08675 [Lactiplantibacillus paraplantarum]